MDETGLLAEFTSDGVPLTELADPDVLERALLAILGVEHENEVRLSSLGFQYPNEERRGGPTRCQPNLRRPKRGRRNGFVG